MKRTLILMIISVCSIWAQSFDGSSIGLAGNYSVLSRGVDALAWNPANLTLPRGNGIEINLFSLNSNLYNNSFSLNSYNRFFTQQGNGGKWSAGDRKDLLDVISDDGLRLDLAVNANLLGVAFNNFGLAVQVVGEGYAKFANNKKPFEIALFGEDIDRAYEYNQKSQAEAAAYSALKVSMGYAYPVNMKWLRRDLKDLAIGISWNQYVGFAVAQLKKSSVFFQRIPGDEESLKYAVALEARTAFSEDGSSTGKGQGFDLGFASGYGRDLDFSLSFSNLGGSITWTQNTKKIMISNSDSLAFADMQDNNRISTSTEIDTTISISSFTTSLPVIMRMGAVYRLLPEWKVTVEYDQGLNKAFGNSLVPRVGVGTQYYALDWLPLRAGIAFGGRDGSQIGLGFGVHLYFVKLNYSYSMKGALWPTYSRGFFNALDLKLAF